MAEVLPEGLDVSCPLEKDMVDLMEKYMGEVLEDGMGVLQEEGVKLR